MKLEKTEDLTDCALIYSGVERKRVCTRVSILVDRKWKGHITQNAYTNERML